MKIKAILKGVVPLMFDRYPGDNNTQLTPQEKMYMTEKGELYLPSINLYSMLASENGKSACKQVCGKKWHDTSQAIACQTNITPFDIPITANGKQIIFEKWNDKIFVHKSVARIKKGTMVIPSPKERPVINAPWEIAFDIELAETKDLSFETLRNLFKQSESIGIGTFRPYFGRFKVEKFEIE